MDGRQIHGIWRENQLITLLNWPASPYIIIYSSANNNGDYKNSTTLDSVELNVFKIKFIDKVVSEDREEMWVGLNHSSVFRRMIVF